MPTYFLTWTTYGSHLPGDPRGSVDKQHNIPGTPRLKPHRRRYAANRAQLKSSPVRFSPAQRNLLDNTIREHCLFRHWLLHALNVRTNHVHIVVTADASPSDVMGKLKSRCSRRLRELDPHLSRIWTTHGSTRWLNTNETVMAAIRYVLHHQTHRPSPLPT